MRPWRSKTSAAKATAVANANIAFVKYWGDADPVLHLPANASISMNLGGLSTVTTVVFQAQRETDEAIIDGTPAGDAALRRVTAHLDRVRALAGTRLRARMVSRNNFPAGAGLASSASAFAALTLAATAALGLTLTEDTLSALARLGSGSACRSIPPGFVEWAAGESHGTSCARSIAPPDHWPLCDCIAVVSTAHKAVGSAEGHARAPSSPLYRARVEGAPTRVAACRAAILAHDLPTLGKAMETDTAMMHAVTMTSRPPIYYWTPATLRVIRAVIAWRAEGLPTYYTVDAGPNVHCLCEEPHAVEVARRLEALPGVQRVRIARPSGGARLVSEHLA
jgi:diphosphomevalonate decarboxylase